MIVNEEQSSKQQFPIELTEIGIVIVINEEHL
jgi:hypothetical protein